jgi:hypothetical protein
MVARCAPFWTPALRCWRCRRIGGTAANGDGQPNWCSWQRAAELLLAETDVAALSKAVELALFYDAKLVLT